MKTGLTQMWKKLGGDQSAYTCRTEAKESRKGGTTYG